MTDKPSDQPSGIAPIDRRKFLALGAGAAGLLAAGLPDISLLPRGPGKAAAAAPSPALDRSTLPIPDPPFTGKSGLTLDPAESVPDWGITEFVRPPEGAPNIMLVVIDDVGFGNPSTFGGPIQTPTLGRLAAGGLSYNRFHVTALCSPTRSALLTGRNHHHVAQGSVAEFSGPYPGYTALRPKDCAPFPQVLQMNGYATGAFGKWHLTPELAQGPAGPTDRWPNDWGFDHFWGILGGEAGQYDPVVTQDNTVIGVPTEENYYWPDDMAGKTIEWLHGVRAHDATRPFFLYYATGAAHAPHQVPPEWSAKYKGKFDQGWDVYRQQTFARQKKLGVIPADTVLTPRPDAIPAWEPLSADEKALYARQMEVYAGYQENVDWNLGRVVTALREMGELDNTVIICMWGDNGASMEGTTTGTFNEMTTINGVPLTPQEQLKLTEEHGGEAAWGTAAMAPHYAAGWAWAGNTPFQWGKQVASYLGGTRAPLVIHWPDNIRDRGGMRSQFTHCNDIAPTVLEIAKLPAPTSVNGITQDPIHGTSLAYTFRDAKAPERHTKQYFEIYGNLAMYKDGWWGASMLPRIPWDLTPATWAKFAPGVYDPLSQPWELYYLPDDYSQAHNLAAQNPAKVAELKKLFFDDAGSNLVTPLLGGLAGFFGIAPPSTGQTKWVYHGDVQNVLPGVIPPIFNRSYTITADLTIPRKGAEGVIVAEADDLGGFALFVENNRLVFAYSNLAVKEYRIQSTRRMPPGQVTVSAAFTADTEGAAGGGGTLRLRINGRPSGAGRIGSTVPGQFTVYSGMDIGRDNGLPVDLGYADKLPFAFTGTVRTVTFDIPQPTNRTTAETLHRTAVQGQVARGLVG
jgi:arylsulfatase A-like enzyme